MRCSEIIELLQQLAPESMACEWDNPGLLAGRQEKDVNIIYLALDATDQVIEDAIEKGADLLLTHHPLIFKPLKQVNDRDFIGRRIVKLIQNDISYYAMHTNFDSAPGCMADLAANRLGILDGQVLEPMGEQNGEVYGIGKAGKLPKAVTLKELAMQVKEAFHLPFVTVYGDLESKDVLKTCAVSPGAGGSMIVPALNQKADVLITGDIGHHQGIDSVSRHMAIIDAGHYGLEHIFMDFMETYLNEKLEGQVRIVKAALQFPATVISI